MEKLNEKTYKNWGAEVNINLQNYYLDDLVSTTNVVKHVSWTTIGRRIKDCNSEDFIMDCKILPKQQHYNIIILWLHLDFYLLLIII